MYFSFPRTLLDLQQISPAHNSYFTDTIDNVVVLKSFEIHASDFFSFEISDYYIFTSFYSLFLVLTEYE